MSQSVELREGQPSTAVPMRSKKRRVALACNFCRQRKIKCNALKPCNNCQTYEKSCIFSTRQSIRDPSPAVSRNPSPATNLGPSANQPPQGDSPYASHFLARGNETSLRNQISRPKDTRPDAVSNTNYYGPTSAHFDESAASSFPSRLAHRRQVPPDLVEKLLLAEAAHQRQMETINFNAGKLDFDGVDPDLGLHLLSLHWNRQHHSFLLTYRSAFMRDMACGGRYFSKLLLNAIYYGASKFSPRLDVRKDPDDVRTAGWQYRQRVKELLADALDKSEITTIQALLVMTNSLFALGDERSAAWLYAGLAFRMIVDLGLHVDASVILGHGGRRLTEEDLEIRRRVFWGAFVVDKIQSLYQGRPPSLQDIDARVPITFHDRFEELEAWTPFAFNDLSGNYRPSPAYSVSTFTQLCKLCVIMNKIINRVYAEKHAWRPSSNLSQDRIELQGELKAWGEALPAHLEYHSITRDNVPPPHVISLQAMYNVLFILLNRPFVSEGVAAEAFSICAAAATRINILLSAYDAKFSVKRAPYLMSYATYVAATIHVRIAAQQNSGSDAHINLQKCLHVLEKNQETNWAVRKARKVIVDLAERMGVTYSPQTSEHSEEPSTREGQNDPNFQSGDKHGLGSPEPVSVQTADFSYPELDLDAIIHSFVQDHGDNRHNTSVENGGQNMGHGIRRFSETANGSEYDVGYSFLTIGAQEYWEQQQHMGPFEEEPTGNAAEDSGMSLISNDMILDDALYGFSRGGLDTWWEQ